MRKKRYKKRISATRRFLLSVVAITMLVINIIIPLQVVVAEFMINEQLNDDGEGTIESEDEVSDDYAESTEPELNIEDSTEDTSVDEPSSVPDDDNIPKEESTDESIEENVAEEDKQQQESDISKEQENGSSKEEKTDGEVEENLDAEVAENNQKELESSSTREVAVTVFNVEELRAAIKNAGTTKTIIQLDTKSQVSSETWVLENQIRISKGQDIALISAYGSKRFTLQQTYDSTSAFYVGGSLTLSNGVTLTSKALSDYGVVNVDGESAKLIMFSGSIVTSDRSNIPLIRVERSGNFIMNGGDLIGGMETSIGNAGIEVSSGGSIVMNGGSVRNIKTGGVKVGANATFQMNGGTITNNSSMDNGGGINISNTSGTVILKGGTIANNSTQKSGGGIYATDYSSLTISDSVIFSGNQAGNGVYVPPENAASLYPNIQSTSASVSIYGRADHPLNNYDISTEGITGKIRAYVLTTAVAPGEVGNVSIPSVSEIENTFFLPNINVEIEAVANSGFIFQNWTSAGGGTFADNGKAKSTFKMPTNDTTITANFSEVQGRKFIEIFPDEKLAKVIANYFKRNVEDYVTDAELLEVEVVTGDGKGIQSLEGIEELQNLHTLALQTNQIEDLAPISSLTKLKSLSLNNNKISDLRPLENLQNLETLHLGSNQIEDLAPISSLRKLSILAIGFNKISYISPLANLANLANLKTLQINNNEISDLRPLESIRSQLNTFNASNQKIELDVVEIGVPTTFNIYNVDGSTPTVNISGGKYEDGQLTWNSAGDKSAGWTGSNFTGTFTQRVIPGTTLRFESVPDAIEFEEAPIQNGYMTINRKESMSLSIRDTRGEGSTWSIQVSMDSPFISEDGEHRLPDDALVFKGSDGQIKPLSNDPIEVYSGKPTSESLTTEVSWKEDEGILVHMQTKAAKPDTRYQTSITWTLHNTPL